MQLCINMLHYKNQVWVDIVVSIVIIFIRNISLNLLAMYSCTKGLKHSYLYEKFVFLSRLFEIARVHDKIKHRLNISSTRKGGNVLLC